MKLGTYGNGNTKFKKLTISKCSLTMWDYVKYGSCGCGATALGLITGDNPFHITNKRKHFRDRFMVEYLRKRNFSIHEVTQSNLSNKKKWSHSISDNHLLLFSMLIQKKECTWMVGWNNILYHNFEILKTNYLDFINFPIDSMYVVYKKDWK